MTHVVGRSSSNKTSYGAHFHDQEEGNACTCILKEKTGIAGYHDVNPACRPGIVR